MSFFYLFIYFIVIANIYFFQIDRLEPSFTDSVFRFRFRDCVSVSGFRIPSFSAAVHGRQMNADQKTSDIEGCAKDYMNLCPYYEYENVGQICKQISGN